MSYVITIGGTTINTASDTMPYVLSKTINLNPRADNRNSCSFTIVTTAATFLPRVGQDVIVTEGATRRFGGIVKNCPTERIGAGTGTSTPLYIDVMSDGYSDIPSRRTITAEYYAETAGNIVTDYIDNFLVDEGVTAGTISAGMTLAAYRRGAMSMKESLDELADLSGFKWYIDDNKAFQFKQEDTVTAAAYSIIEGGAFTDFRDVKVEEDLTLYRNKQVIKGGVLEDGSVYIYSAQDDTEITARIAIEGGSGVYGNVYEDSNILNDTDAAVVANNLLKRYGKVPIHLSFNTDTNEFLAGTKLTVNLPTFGISTNTSFLIEDVVIRDTGAGNLRSFISATRRDDTDFSTQRTGDYKDYFADLIKASKASNSGSEVVLTYLVDKNAAAVELTTSAKQVLTKQFTLRQQRTLQVDIAVQLECQASQMVTCVIEVDGTPRMTYREWFYVDGAIANSKQHIFDVSFPLEDEAASTSKTVTVKMQTDTSTADIAIEGAYLVIAARGIEPPGINLNPEIALELSAIISADPVVTLAVASDTAQTITPATLVAIASANPTYSMFVVYERYQTGDDAQLEIYGDNWEGQSFTTQVAHTVDRVGVKVYRTGSPDTLTAEIYATASDLPTGSALASGTYDGDTLGTATAGAWISISFGAGTALDVSTKYALVLRCGGDASNKIHWRNDASSPTYTGGARVSSTDAGTSWAEDTTRDYMFEEGDAL